MGRKRVVIAGLGDSGVLTAINLARHADVVGISAKPALVSGQELGLRISRPNDWARDNWISFDRFRGLDRVRTVHGTLTGVDLAARIVFVKQDDGSPLTEPYDALIISTGVTNGFWRRSTLQSADEIAVDLQAAHDRLAATESVIVVGGGAAAVSSAANMAITWPGKRSICTSPAIAACLNTIRERGRAIDNDSSRSVWSCTPATAPCCPTVSRATRSPTSPCSGAPARRRRRPMPCFGG